MPLNVSVEEKEGDIFIITPVGVVDTSTYPILEEQVDSILAKSPKVIVFKMADVTYISSAGVRVVLKAKKGLKQTGGKLMMVNLQPRIKKVFDIINAMPTEQIFSSVEELDAYLDSIQKQI